MTDRHEEAIEKAAAAAWTYDVAGINHGWEDELARMKDAYREQARAAITGYLAHAHPTLTTVQDVEALPVGTIIVDDIGIPHQHDTDGEGTWWWDRVSTEEYYTSSEIELPARVIWWPNTDA